jgi:crotonobetainyl-CoA:carnitine CoA-transferase CaiB-like acyl-CoA transferase
VYDLLAGIRVLDVSLLAPSMLGAQLADLGAEVIKVEAPPRGDHSRLVGGPFRDGPSLTHLRWNRGKKSLGLNLKSPDGPRVFLELAAKSQVIVDGLRAGAMTRFGTDYDAVRAVNPRIVYCAISGVGHSGPYRELGGGARTACPTSARTSAWARGRRRSTQPWASRPRW